MTQKVNEVYKQTIQRTRMLKQETLKIINH